MDRDVSHVCTYAVNDVTFLLHVRLVVSTARLTWRARRTHQVHLVVALARVVLLAVDVEDVVGVVDAEAVWMFGCLVVRMFGWKDRQ